jgi:hypothetical protein
MTEHLKYLGRRQELELEKKKILIRINGLIKNMRDALDPLTPVAELRTDAIAEWAIELANAKDRYTEILNGLKQIEDILGK